jgi:maleylpyruvate isomerase
MHTDAAGTSNHAAGLVLYGYFRSSAAYRVRIALNLKGQPHEQRAVHLVRDGGAQHKPEYAALNAQRLVPTLVHGSVVITQSMAIIEYLDELYKDPPLLPKGVADRAWVRSVAQAIACDVHPLNNLRVLRYLVNDLAVTEKAKLDWYRHWCVEGLTALEAMISPHAGMYCFGDTLTLADVMLIPQLANARRFDVDLTPFPTLMRIEATCARLDAFEKAQPARQPDAE